MEKLIEYVKAEIEEHEEAYKIAEKISPTHGGAWKRGYHNGQIKALNKVLLRLNALTLDRRDAPTN